MELVAQSPQQGHFRLNIERMTLSIDRQLHMQGLQKIETIFVAFFANSQKNSK
jgi:hypothetical protein